jgi:hypothetical protein
MDYAALRAEIAQPAYAGLSDAEIAAALNAEIDAVRNVATSDARALLLATGEWGAITLLARQEPSESVPAEAIAAAITAIDTLKLTEVLETTKTPYWQAVQAMVAGLQAAGVLSEATGTALLGLRETTTTRAAQLGLGQVSPGDIQTARST